MSSGVEAEIVLDAAVIASLGMNRLLGAGANAGSKTAEVLAALAEKKAGGRAEALAEVERYERALREVIDRNARIRALGDVLRRTHQEHGVVLSVPLPAELNFTGAEDYGELVTWCAAVDEALDKAERAIAEELGRLVTAQLKTPANRSEDLSRVLSRLLPDTSEADRRRVQEAAVRVAQATTDAEAEAMLSEVRLRVQEAGKNVKAERERLKAWALEQDRLAQAEAERQYILATVTKTFEELGYQVDTGFSTFVPVEGSLLLTRSEWPDQAVRMQLDDSTLRAKMMRTRPALSEDDRRRDAEREREWCDAFEAAKERLREDGLDMALTWRLEPGAEELPLGAQSTTTTTQKKNKPRERRLEH
ncbi:response regulator receiver protein [Actinocorallia sp. B10E7]|uniref:response regulator receiver protein n=1 Tax=Actinocorallia sp. B10E7 TaxID=3153558 RepID=UPI00325CA6E1